LGNDVDGVLELVSLLSGNFVDFTSASLLDCIISFSRRFLFDFVRFAIGKKEQPQLLANWYRRHITLDAMSNRLVAVIINELQ
jgi:hypothetical protein